MLSRRLTNKEVVPGEDPLVGARIRVAQLLREHGLLEQLTTPRTPGVLISPTDDRAVTAFVSPDTARVESEAIEAAIGPVFNPRLRPSNTDQGL